jgi:hypothetical protein
MNEDPKLHDAGDPNLFRYCKNDPMDLTDPMGLENPFWLDATLPGAYEADKMMTEFHAGNYWTAAGWGVTSFVQTYVGVMTFGRSTQAKASLRAAQTATRARPVVAVLGKWRNSPNFKTVAENLGLKSMNMPQKTWEAMSPGEREYHLYKYIDKYAAKGDFMFDKPIKSIESVSGSLRKELDHLTDVHNFKLNAEGTKMMKEPTMLEMREEADIQSRHTPPTLKP